jgi:hypothetical protein
LTQITPAARRAHATFWRALLRRDVARGAAYNKAVRSVLVLVLCAASACGRFGFDATGSDDSDGADADGADADDPDDTDADDTDADDMDADDTDGPPIDGAIGACAGGDNTCGTACGSSDPDCAPACGDSVCTEIGGETCASCDDCETAADVCGNGECSATESSATCLTDCGPAAWPWAQDEMNLFAAVNAARTEGRSCDGTTTLTAPALTWDPAVLPFARNWAWEEAHLHPNTPGFRRCSGRSWSAVYADANIDTANVTSGALTTQARLDQWLGEVNACMAIMSTGNTTGAIGIAIDDDDSFVVLLR